MIQTVKEIRANPDKLDLYNFFVFFFLMFKISYYRASPEIRHIVQVVASEYFLLVFLPVDSLFSIVHTGIVTQFVRKEGQPVQPPSAPFSLPPKPPFFSETQVAQVKPLPVSPPPPVKAESLVELSEIYTYAMKGDLAKVREAMVRYGEDILIFGSSSSFQNETYVNRR